MDKFLEVSYFFTPYRLRNYKALKKMALEITFNVMMSEIITTSVTFTDALK